MGSILSVEKSQFINKQINIYSKNKVGQYSKYLDKNPIFVTYYSINNVISRADIGTGSVLQEYGANSPIRYNKIQEFPIYNVPELKPSAEYDETGFDINIDLSGLIILPNTIKPVIGDVIIISIPNSATQLLIRVNNFEYNTIQANDFYQVDGELKRTGQNVESEISSQIVENYVCIFDNIGTEDKCIIKVSDYEKSEVLYTFIRNLRDYYDNAFFNIETGDYVLYTGVGSDITDFNGNYYYDMYLARFINDSKMYFDKFDNKTKVLVYNDAEPINFDFLYQKSLLWAIINKETSYIAPYMYRMFTDISKTYSIYKLYNMSCTANSLLIFNDEVDESSSAYQAYPIFAPYYNQELLIALKNGTEYTTENSFNMLVYNYIKGNAFEVSNDDIMSLTYSQSLDTYMQIPIVIYILIQKYREYYTKEKI